MYSVPGVIWATCIFESTCVIVRYYYEKETSANDSDAIERALNSHLRPPAGFCIKSERLNGKPVCRKTALCPGQPVNDPSGVRNRCIGGFVNVEGKGFHALVAGHGLQEGHQLKYADTDKTFGTVTAVCCTDDMEAGTCDAALIKLDGGFTTSVHVRDQVERSLSTRFKRPRNNMQLQKFCNNPEGAVGIVKHNDYTSYAAPPSPARCFAVVSSNGDDYRFHEAGESGRLVSTIPAMNGVTDEVVNPVGMLVSTEFVEKTEDGCGYTVSIAVPLERSLHQLSSQPYCDNKALSIVGVAE